MFSLWSEGFHKEMSSTTHVQMFMFFSQRLTISQQQQ